MLLGMVVPALVPAFASAGNLTTRSIAMSTSAANAAGASYAVTFTPSGGSWQHLVIDWCDESPIIGAGTGTCSLPSGFDASSVTVSGGAAIGTASLNGSSTAGHTIIDGTAASTSTSPFTVTLTGVHNRTSAASFYARMYTYATVNYTATDNLGTTVDTGAVALATTNTVGISAAVRETMTFCVSKTAPTANCGGTDDPSLTLGEGTAPNIALDSTHLSTGTNYAQISTNAASGAVVNLKSNRTGCGGLVRVGVANCDIKPSGVNGNGNAAIGSALFGLTVGSPVDASGATNATGTFQAAGSYNSSDYYMDYVTGDATGVTSAYGSPVLDTNSLPINNKNIPLTFGASVSNTTPAGLYSATLNLIATGTF
jgi:hypothetical protein